MSNRAVTRSNTRMRIRRSTPPSKPSSPPIAAPVTCEACSPRALVEQTERVQPQDSRLIAQGQCPDLANWMLRSSHRVIAAKHEAIDAKQFHQRSQERPIERDGVQPELIQVGRGRPRDARLHFG